MEFEVPKQPARGGFKKGNRLGRHFSEAERKDYREELAREKAEGVQAETEALQAEISQLKRDKLVALLNRRGRPTRR